MTGCMLTVKPVMADWAPKKMMSTIRRRVPIMKPHQGKVDFMT